MQNRNNRKLTRPVNRGRQTRGPRQAVAGCVAFLFVAIMGLGFVVVIGMIFTAQMKVTAPNAYDQAVAEALDLPLEGGTPSAGGGQISSSGVISPTLSVQDSATVQAQGLDPTYVALAIEAADSLKTRIGVEIGPGIILAIFQGETSNGTDLGTTQSARAGGQGHSGLNATEETQALDFMLNHWKTLDLRSKDPLAAKYINEDYTDAIAHTGANAMGHVGFIASTGKRVCEQYLIPSGDAELATCNWWNIRVAFHAAAYYLNQIGFRLENDVPTNADKLWGWNQDKAYDQMLAENSIKFYEQVAELGVIYQQRSLAPFGEVASHDNGRDTMIYLLDRLGFLPQQYYDKRKAAIAQVPPANPAPTSPSGSSVPVTQIPQAASTGETPAKLDTTTMIPIADGELENVMIWVKLHPTITIPPTKDGVEPWSFCESTGENEGWSKYLFAANINAGGICANATIIKYWVDNTPGLELETGWLKHQELKPTAAQYVYAFEVIIDCPSADMRVINNTDQPITGEFVMDGDNLVLRTVTTSPATTAPSVATPAPVTDLGQQP